MNMLEGHYYELVDDVVARAAANTTAGTYKLLGVSGHLVSITSLEEHAFLLGIGARGWIGAHDIASEGTFLWDSGPDASRNINASGFAVPWAVGSPLAPATSNTRDCLQFTATGWTDAVCTTTAMFIVEYECALGLEFNATGCQGVCNAYERLPLLHLCRPGCVPDSRLRRCGVCCD